ncbi:hypothetical protein BTH42_22890 [Burkholderia sp. SRS-W-2-2016]|nr:hypothetical protein BTH42_22890 [Burkholderia sp. SRS-W-2-2016]
MCEAHDVTRWTLTNTIVGPAAEELLHVSGARMSRDIGRAAYNLNVSSLTEQANRWAQTLNYLTHRNNLQLCTLLPLKSLVSEFVLLSEKERFCPGCHEDDARLGRDCYERLLWSIDAAKACPLHRLQLVSRPQAKQRRTSKRRNGSLAHEVAAQYKIGETPIHIPASDFEVETSRLIAELLDDAVYFSNAGYSATAQSVFLTHAINLLFDGVSARFAAHLGISKSQVHGWVKDSVQMSFPRLVQTAYCCGCAIADILLGNSVMLSLRPAPSEQCRRLVLRGGTRARRPNEDLRAELDALIRSGRANNATEAARAVGISLKYLKNNFPEQQEFLVRHGRELSTSLRREETETFNDMYLTEHNALRAAGEYPSRRRVVARLRGKIGLGSRQRVQRAYLKAFAETGMKIAGSCRRRMTDRPDLGREDRRV